MKRALALLVYSGLIAFAGAAAAQTDRATANRDTLLNIMVGSVDDPKAMAERTSAFLDSIPMDEAFKAQAAVLKLALQGKHVSRVEFARGMLSLNLRYAPDDDVALDYWRYVIVIAAKLERGEIPIEEYEYLEARKMAEAKRASSEQTAKIRAEDAQRAYLESVARAQSEAANRDAIGAVLQGIGRAIRPAPTVTTNCVRIGSSMNCSSR